MQAPAELHQERKFQINWGVPYWNGMKLLQTTTEGINDSYEICLLKMQRACVLKAWYGVWMLPSLTPPMLQFELYKKNRVLIKNLGSDVRANEVMATPPESSGGKGGNKGRGSGRGGGIGGRGQTGRRHGRSQGGKPLGQSATGGDDGDDGEDRRSPQAEEDGPEVDEAEAIEEEAEEGDTPRESTLQSPKKKISGGSGLKRKLISPASSRLTGGKRGLTQLSDSPLAPGRELRPRRESRDVHTIQKDRSAVMTLCSQKELDEGMLLETVEKLAEHTITLPIPFTLLQRPIPELCSRLYDHQHMKEIQARIRKGEVR
jgi:hypothetical protein